MATQTQGPLGLLEPLGGGNSIPLVKEQLRIGRRESCDICLRFANVSSEHCELRLEHGYWSVRDLNSKNGVKVNGERVPEKRLYPGDEICIAKHRYRIEYTPTTARSADAEVDELHEDIMRFSLLERAGIAKKTEGDKGKAKPTKKPPAEDEAAAYLGGRSDTRSDRVDLRQLEESSTGLTPEESQVESLAPASSAVDLTEDEFMKLVEEDKRRKKKQ